MIQPPDTAEMCYNTTRFEGLRIALHEWGRGFESLTAHQSTLCYNSAMHRERREQHMALTRRSFIASSAAFAAAGCAAPGVAGALKEHTCPPFWKTYRDAAHTFEGRTLYDSWRRTGNLRGAYFGHDHMNTFDGTDANGIRLGMTKCCTFGSYNDNNIGVRVFTVRPDGTYATSIFAEADC